MRLLKAAAERAKSNTVRSYHLQILFSNINIIFQAAGFSLFN